MNKDLIAPCGMNCAVCSSYLAYTKGIPKKRGAISHCAGCRPRTKQCAYLKGHCDQISKGLLRFCYECRQFPCQRLQHLDERYRKNFNVSLVGNLRQLAEKGLAAFLADQRQQHRCGRCGGILCVHNGKCYDCDVIENWRGK